MNDLDALPLLKGPPPRPALPAPDHDAPEAPPTTPEGRGGSGRRLFGLGVLVLFMAALALGVWRHYAQHRQVVDTAEQQANFVPNVHVEAVASRLGKLHISLPGTTLAFEAANIYARASGYVSKLCRYRRSRQGRAASRRNYCTRSRGAGCPISEYSAAGSGDGTPKRSTARVDRCDQQAYFRPCQGQLGDTGTGRHRSVQL